MDLVVIQFLWSIVVFAWLYPKSLKEFKLWKRVTAWNRRAQHE